MARQNINPASFQEFSKCCLCTLWIYMSVLIFWKLCPRPHRRSAPGSLWVTHVSRPPFCFSLLNLKKGLPLSLMQNAALHSTPREPAADIIAVVGDRCNYSISHREASLTVKPSPSRVVLHPINLYHCFVLLRLPALLLQCTNHRKFPHLLMLPL